MRSTGCFEKFFLMFFSLFSLIIKIDFVKLSMQFLIHLKLKNWNINSQNVLLYVFWQFLSSEVQNIRAPKVSYFTFFSRRSEGSCLSSSSVFVFVFVFVLFCFVFLGGGEAGWIFVCCLDNDTPDGPYGTHIRLVFRPVDLWYKVCKVFWHHVSSVRRFFLFKTFRILLQIAGHNSPYRCSRNFDIMKLKNLLPFFLAAFW